MGNKVYPVNLSPSLSEHSSVPCMMMNVQCMTNNRSIDMQSVNSPESAQCNVPMDKIYFRGDFHSKTTIQNTCHDLQHLTMQALDVDLDDSEEEEEGPVVPMDGMAYLKQVIKVLINIFLWKFHI